MNNISCPIVVAMLALVSAPYTITAQTSLPGFGNPPFRDPPDEEQTTLISKLWPVNETRVNDRVPYDLSTYFTKAAWQKLGTWQVNVYSQSPDEKNVETNLKIVEPVQHIEKATVDISVCPTNYDALVALWIYRQSSSLPDFCRQKIGKAIGDASISRGSLEDSSSGLGFVRGNVFVKIKPIIRDPNRKKVDDEMPYFEIKDATEYTTEDKAKMEKASAEANAKYKAMPHPERDEDTKGAPKLVADLAKLMDEKIQAAIKEEQQKPKK